MLQEKIGLENSTKETSVQKVDINRYKSTQIANENVTKP